MATIYLVDDDPDFTEAVRLVLEKEGHTISTADNPGSGFAMIQKALPDLLVLDIMMQSPDDGIVLARKLKKEGFKFPVLMLSAIGSHTGMSYDTDNEMLPADAFIEKPVMPVALIEKVNQLLAHTK